MTEDEAKTKWCPFVRYVSEKGEGINRWVTNDDAQHNPKPARCIASACMAWRTVRPSQEYVYQKTRPEGEGWHDEGNPGWWRRTTGTEDGGFCGLAGAPQ